jgi:hypothetical protein
MTSIVDFLLFWVIMLRIDKDVSCMVYSMNTSNRLTATLAEWAVA